MPHLRVGLSRRRRRESHESRPHERLPSEGDAELRRRQRAQPVQQGVMMSDVTPSLLTLFSILHADLLPKLQVAPARAAGHTLSVQPESIERVISWYRCGEST